MQCVTVKGNSPLGVDVIGLSIIELKLDNSKTKYSLIVSSQPVNDVNPLDKDADRKF